MQEGKPLARLVPMPIATDDLAQRRHRTLEELRGSITILGDIMEPIADWEINE